MVVVAEHAALRRARRPAGVDEGGQVRRAHRRRQRRGVVGAEDVVPGVDPRRRRARPRVADDDDVAESRRGRRRPRSARSSSADSTMSTHAPESASWWRQVLALVRGVDGDGDGAGVDDAPPGQHGLRRVLDERGDAVARAHAELRAARWPARAGRRGHLGGGRPWCRRRRGTRRRGRARAGLGGGRGPSPAAR